MKTHLSRIGISAQIAMLWLACQVLGLISKSFSVLLGDDEEDEHDYILVLGEDRQA